MTPTRATPGAPPPGPRADADLDLAMPVMDGWAFLAERARDPDLRALPVLVMSGQRDVADQVAALHAGYLAKPAAMDRLLDAVARAAH
jgi:CheY-like chemotaxis protein